MKTKLSLLSLLVVAALVLAACSSSNNTTPQAYQPAVGVKNTQIIPVTGGAAEVDLGKADSLGSFLVDAKGMTLYLYTKDSPNKTVCYDKCAQAWPPLLTGPAPTAGTGVDSAKLGTIQRTDGTTQVTYNGWPLYYYVSDAKAGDITGQGVGSVWFVVSAAGDLVQASLPAATIAPTVMAPAAAVSGSTVEIAKNDTLGSFLVDGKGMTLYLYTKDTPNTTVCYEQCAINWPPLLVTDKPTAGNGLDAAKLGTIQRTDGTMQVTYNGWPLYYFKSDQKAGDTVGQGVGSVWYVLTPAGDMVTTY